MGKTGSVFLVLFGNVLLAGAGCGNPCQHLCDQLAEYANECELNVTPDDLKGCKSDFAGKNLEEGDAETCAASNSANDIREWWTCDDLAESFTNSVD